MRYLTVERVIRIHDYQISRYGGSFGIRSYDLLESAVAQPRATFEGRDLYPTIAEKATTLAFSLVQNHPFEDGNKRTGLESMIMFLSRNGYRILTDRADMVDIFERVAGKRPRIDRSKLLFLINTNINYK